MKRLLTVCIAMAALVTASAFAETKTVTLAVSGMT